MVIDVNLDPTKGSETGKVRLSVIVTNNIYNARVPVIQVVPLTAWSGRKARIITNVGNYAVVPKRTDQEVGGGLSAGPPG